jgi:nucleoside-diphosphate-sugar epimerase
MRIAIIGGTGTLGKRLVEQLRSRGHEARALCRHSPEFPIDLTTGNGIVLERYRFGDTSRAVTPRSQNPNKLPQIAASR